jgi:hypothetical protein
MALITTMMTNPLLNLVEFLAKKRILKYGEPYKY